MSYTKKKFDQILPEYVQELIPKQSRGISRDTVVVYEEEHTDFKFYYEEYKNRLEHVNDWVNYTSITPLNFQIYDNQERALDRKLKLGDLIKIEMDKKQKISIFDRFMADWVFVEQLIEVINEEERLFILQLIPIESPKLNEVTHFFNEMASNTFILYQCPQFVSLSIHGRNEFPNFMSKSRFRILRNIMIANLSLIGVDNYLWNNFAINILKP